MAVEGVLLTYDYFENKAKHTAAASGIKYSSRWILTHGMFLAPLYEAKVLKSTNEFNQKVYNNLPNVTVLGEKSTNGRTICDLVENVSKERDFNMEHPSYKIKVMTGRISHIWRCGAIKSCVEDLYSPWTIAHKDADVDQQTTLGKQLLSLFVLIDLENRPGVEDQSPLIELSRLVSPSPRRGTPVEILSTPFGCEVFLNSSTKGYICSSVGRGPSILMSDAASALGCEGGPVFIQGTRELVGIVLNSVSWWKGEWVGMTLVAPLQTVLNEKLGTKPITRPLGTNKVDKIMSVIDRSTVLVRCGTSWGAGVYVGNGYVLTCAHVVKHYGIYKVYVSIGGVRVVATVRYKSTDDVAFDLAVLHLATHLPDLLPAVFDDTPAKKGDAVLAVGFPFFSDGDISSVTPTVTSGHVSNSSPSMLQTSCCIQSGFSGGPILRVEDDHPRVLGVIVSNARVKNGTCYPRVNMAAPNEVYIDALRSFVYENDESKLHRLENKREMIQSQWRLLPFKSKL